MGVPILLSGHKLLLSVLEVPIVPQRVGQKVAIQFLVTARVKKPRRVAVKAEELNVQLLVTGDPAGVDPVVTLPPVPVNAIRDSRVVMGFIPACLQILVAAVAVLVLRGKPR
jgi:hypothetical protein